MEAPEGYSSENKNFWKLKKALYGLKQSGMEWNQKLNGVLLKLNFKRLKSEPCLYKKISNRGNIICILAVYVDDIILTGTDEAITETKYKIKEHFKIKDIGDVDFIIGIKFQKISNVYILHQNRYINNILKKF